MFANFSEERHPPSKSSAKTYFQIQAEVKSKLVQTRQIVPNHRDLSNLPQIEAFKAQKETARENLKHFQQESEAHYLQAVMGRSIEFEGAEHAS